MSAGIRTPMGYNQFAFREKVADLLDTLSSSDATGVHLFDVSVVIITRIADDVQWRSLRNIRSRQRQELGGPIIALYFQNAKVDIWVAVLKDFALYCV
jgi:hypothetical protein